MPAVLEAEEAELRDLVFGSVDSGYAWVREGPDWWGAADLQSFDTQRPGGGVTGGRDVRGALMVTASLHVLGESPSDLAAKVDALRLAWRPSDVDLPLRVKLLGQDRVRYGRPRKCAVNMANAHRQKPTATATVQWSALDPYAYSDVEQGAVGQVEIPGVGIVPPFTPPTTLPAGQSGGLNVTNGGNADAPWRARITGPTSAVDHPFILHEGSGLYLDFAANGGLEIPSGQWVDIDTRTRSVLLNGTADRRFTLTSSSRWFGLAPGPNPLRLAGSGSLQLFWRDTWE